MREEGRKQEEGLEKGEEDEEKESQVSLKGCSQWPKTALSHLLRIPNLEWQTRCQRFWDALDISYGGNAHLCSDKH